MHVDGPGIVAGGERADDEERSIGRQESILVLRRGRCVDCRQQKDEGERSDRSCHVELTISG